MSDMQAPAIPLDEGWIWIGDPEGGWDASFPDDPDNDECEDGCLVEWHPETSKLYVFRREGGEDYVESAPATVVLAVLAANGALKELLG